MVFVFVRDTSPCWPNRPFGLAAHTIAQGRFAATSQWSLLSDPGDCVIFKDGGSTDMGAFPATACFRPGHGEGASETLVDPD